MNPFQEMADRGGKGEPTPAAVNPFRAGAEKIAAEKAETEMAAYAAAMMNPEPVKHRRAAKAPKLGGGSLSHDVDDEIDEDKPRGLNYLTIEQVERAYKAMMLLHCLGLGMNIWYSCTWASVGRTTDEGVADAVERHIESLRKWLSRKGEKFHYLWVVERGESRGLHMHVLMRLPKEIPLKRLERQISRSIRTITHMYPRCPAKPPKRAKRSKPFDPSDNPFAGLDIVPIDPDDTKTVHIEPIRSVGEQWHLWRYMMKGADPEEVVYIRGGRDRRPEWIPLPRYLGLEKVSHEGRYEGLRFGRSQALGPEAWDMFEAKHGMPRNPFWTARKSRELYGSQFLNFAKALANPKPKPKPGS